MSRCPPAAVVSGSAWRGLGHWRRIENKLRTETGPAPLFWIKVNPISFSSRDAVLRRTWTQHGNALSLADMTANRSTQTSALIVDDERDIRELLVLTLGRMGLRCDTASSLADARALLRHNQYALCLTDMRLTDGTGVDLVKDISQLYPDTPVAMITAFGNQEAAVDALK